MKTVAIWASLSAAGSTDESIILLKLLHIKGFTWSQYCFEIGKSRHKWLEKSRIASWNRSGVWNQILANTIEKCWKNNRSPNQ